MWKSVYKQSRRCVAVEVTKGFHRGNAVYSLRFTGARKDGTTVPFVSLCDDDTDEVIFNLQEDFHCLLQDANDFIVQDKAKDAALERKRQEGLSGRGNQRNPNANKGLGRFKKKGQLDVKDAQV